MDLEFKETNEKNEPIIQEDENEIDFFGMSKDKDIDPVTYVRKLRKGRQFDFSGCDFSNLYLPKNS